MNISNHPRLSSKWIWALAAISCTLAAGTASAGGTSSETRSVKVRYADLNLSTREGATALYGRLKRAAREVCGLDYLQPEERTQSNKWKTCYDDAIGAAVTKVNSPMLSAVHSSKYGPSQARTLLSQQPSPQAK
jgi:UrcA family protein